jgi:hypothetical protein
VQEFLPDGVREGIWRRTSSPLAGRYFRRDRSVVMQAKTMVAAMLAVLVALVVAVPGAAAGPHTGSKGERADAAPGAGKRTSQLLRAADRFDARAAQLRLKAAKLRAEALELRRQAGGDTTPLDDGLDEAALDPTENDGDDSSSAPCSASLGDGGGDDGSASTDDACAQLAKADQLDKLAGTLETRAERFAKHAQHLRAKATKLVDRRAQKLLAKAGKLRTVATKHRTRATALRDGASVDGEVDEDAIARAERFEGLAERLERRAAALEARAARLAG